MNRKSIFVLAGGAAAGAALLAAVFAAAPYECAVALRRAELRLHGARRVRLEGGLMAYEKNNCLPGAPCRCVALIHGLGDSAMTWDKMLMDPGADEAGVRVVAVDMPGTDGSAPPPTPSGYGVRTQAGALRSALEGRCAGWTVAGNSLGGWIALWLALDWPKGVSELVLLDAAGISDPSGIAEKAARTLAAPSLEDVKSFSRLARFKETKIPQRAWVSAWADIRRRPTQAIVAALSRGELLDGRLGALKLPVTIIWGVADGVIPIEVGERLHRLISGSRFETLTECAHMPQQERPEVVARALFLKRS
jgi:pimeloyl-ACP methyl ester carboxylesterase